MKPLNLTKEEIAKMQNILKKLLELGKKESDNFLTTSEYRAKLLRKNKEQLRELGKEVNSVAGLNGMFWFFNLFLPLERYEIENAWDGIGDWKCKKR